MNNTGEGSTERQRYLSSASQTSYLERVKELARVRDTDPTRYPSALAQVKETLPDVETLLELYPSSNISPTNRSRTRGSSAVPPSSHSSYAGTAVMPRTSPSSSRGGGSLPSPPRTGKSEISNSAHSSLELSPIPMVDGWNGTDHGSRRTHHSGVAPSPNVSWRNGRRLSRDNQGESRSRRARGASVESGRKNIRWPGPVRTPEHARSPAPFLVSETEESGIRGLARRSRAYSGEARADGNGAPLETTQGTDVGETNSVLDDSQASGVIDRILSTLPSRPPEGVGGGSAGYLKDARCIHFYQPIILRGRKGRYLRTVRAEEKEDEDAEDTASTASGISGRGMHASGGLRDFAVHSLGIGGDGAGSLGGTASSRYFRAASAGGLGSVSGGSVLGESIEIVDTKTQFPVDANGMGLGDSAEVLHIASAERRSDQGPMVYGEPICIKSLLGNTKCLRPTSSGGTVFGRIHCGRRERWVILPYEPPGDSLPSSVTPRRDLSPRTPLRNRGVRDSGSVGASSDVKKSVDLDGGRRRRLLGRMGMYVKEGELIELQHTDVKTGAKKSLLMRPTEGGSDGNEWEVGDDGGK